MYKQIIPATDWFYIEQHKEMDTLTIYHLAAWGLTETEGHVIGLISVAGSQRFDKENKMARLVSVPPNQIGSYKHRDELSLIEKKALQNNGYLKNISILKEEHTI